MKFSFGSAVGGYFLNRVLDRGVSRAGAAQAILDTMRRHVLDQDGVPTKVNEPVDVDGLRLTITPITPPSGREDTPQRFHVLVIRPDLPGDNPDKVRDFFYDMRWKNLRHGSGF